jgi:UDP-glucose 4-epimerase
MKVLVTGGAGFIGTNVGRQFLARGDQVTVLDNFTSGYRDNLREIPSARVVEGDVRDRQLVRSVVEGSDAVLHLAASVGNARSIADPITDSEVNVIGTLNILEAARVSGVKKVVLSSSAGIFGELKHLPIREDHPVEPDTPYGAGKLAAEKHCLAYARLHGMECVALRYFNVYGRLQRYDAYGNVIPIFAHRMLAGESLTIYGDGEQTRDFTYVANVVDGVLRACEAPKASGEVINVACGTRISLNQLLETMNRIVGTTIRANYKEPRAGDVRDSQADITKAKEILGYSPLVDLEAGLRHTLAWCRSESIKV